MGMRLPNSQRSPLPSLVASSLPIPRQAQCVLSPAFRRREAGAGKGGGAYYTV